jgi:hypothetical protein
MYSTFRHTDMMFEGVTIASASELPATPFDESCDDPIGVETVVTSYHRNDANAVPTEFHTGTDPTREYVREGFRVRVPNDILRVISSPKLVSV